MFEHIDAYPGDPILTLMETFQQDSRPTKVNLGIGLYYDEQGRLPLLDSVDRQHPCADRKNRHDRQDPAATIQPVGEHRERQHYRREFADLFDRAADPANAFVIGLPAVQFVARHR